MSYQIAVIQSQIEYGQIPCWSFDGFTSQWVHQCATRLDVVVNAYRHILMCRFLGEEINYFHAVEDDGNLFSIYVMSSEKQGDQTITRHSVFTNHLGLFIHDEDDYLFVIHRLKQAEDSEPERLKAALQAIIAKVSPHASNRYNFEDREILAIAREALDHAN